MNLCGNQPVSYVSLHAIEPTQLRQHVASMAWGARNMIPLRH